MKQYVIDELRPGDHEKLKSYLESHCGPAELENLYWVALDASVYSETQTAHTDCQPFYAAVRLDEQAIAIEFLIRTKNRIRCDCIAYATDEQKAWLMGFLDAMFEQLEIRT